MHAALTGHLVLSTIHTNSAVGAISRMRHLGAPSHVLGSSLLGIISQRLVRKVCPECSRPYTPSDEQKDFIRKKFEGIDALPADLTLYKGAGCDRCKQVGYAGRLAIGEIIHIDKTLYRLILNDAPENEVLEHLLSQGYRTIYQDGLLKALNGITTIEELDRVA